MNHLILVRHGETDSNKRGTYLGWTDVALNAAGLEQAESARMILKDYPIDRIYASPLLRAWKTAEIINRGRDIPIAAAEGLKERNFGVWEDLTYHEIVEKYAEEYGMWVKDPGYCIRGGESTLQAYERVNGFTDRILSQYQGKTILLVTHLGSIRNILAHLLGMGMEGCWRFRVDNGGITRLEINDEGYAYLTQLNR